MSTIDELIAIAEGTGTTQPIKRQNIDELISIAESKSQPEFEGMIQRLLPKKSYSGSPLKRDIDYLTTLQEVPKEAPTWAQNHPYVYDALTKSKQLLGPTAQSLAFLGGATLGGPVGAGLASGMEQNLEDIFDVYMGKTPQPTMVQNFLNSARNVVVGTAFEGATKNIGNIKDYIPKPVRDIAGKLVPKKSENMALEAERQGKEIGVNMLPSDVRQSKSLAQIEAGMGRLLGSSSILKHEDKKNIMAIIKEAKRINKISGIEITPEDLGRKIYDQIDDYLKKYADLNRDSLENLRAGIKQQMGSNLTPVKLSETVADEIASANKGMYDKAQELYAKRNKLIPKEGVPLSNTLGIAEKWEKELLKREQTEVDSLLRRRIGEIKKLSQEEIPLDNSIYENLWAKPEVKKIIPKADLNILSEFKSNINADLSKINPAMKYGLEGIKGATRPGQSLENRAYAELANAMERDINAYSKATGGGLSEANKAAINYYREFKTFVNKPDFVNILKTDPTQVLDKINDIADVRMMKKAIGDKKFDTLIKPAFTNKLFGAGAAPFDPQNTVNNLVKYSDVIPEVYSMQEIKLIKEAVEKGTSIAGNMKHVDIKFLSKLVESHDPRVTIESVFTGGKSKYAQRNLGYVYDKLDAKTRDELKYFLSEKILFGGQKIDPSTLLTDKKGYANFSFDVLTKNINNNEAIIRKFHSDKVVDDMKRLANIGKYLQSSGKYAGMKIAETGQSTWALSQIGAFMAALRYGNFPSAMAIMFGPTVATATYLSGPVRNVISHGAVMPEWLKVGAKYGSLMATRENEAERIKKIQVSQLQSQSKPELQPQIPAQPQPQPQATQPFDLMEQLKMRARIGDRDAINFLDDRGIPWQDQRQN
jgi:tetratricopeptide (TPR) repeat protein